MIIAHTTQVPTNDQRRAEWAYRYAMAGYHHEPPELQNIDTQDSERDKGHE